MRCRRVLLPAGAAEAGRGAKRQKLSAVIDHTVNGRVVRRKLVVRLGEGRAPRGGGGALEREASALDMGYAVTEEAAVLPAGLTLGGRLHEVGYRERKTRRGSVATITLESPNADVIQGERELHVYHRGRVVRTRALAKAKPQKGRGPGTTGHESVELLQGSGWVTLAGSELAIDPDEPQVVLFSSTGNPTWLLDREALADAVEGVRTGSEDVDYEPRQEHVEIHIHHVNEGSAALRVSREALRAMLDGDQ